jgi:DNA-binding GntR family transcriptional regulator
MKYSRLASFEESIKEHEKIVEAILLKNVKSAIDALSLNLI